ncbi:hypothetical protein BAE44_0005922 [Dichanthelium oligosanthes]|uniref:Uncharacterized protein n=1 Tax=Dichanthelium oligosanthes TaxID=888268 RepID=A0A1E5W6I8_9POAL|nr:hypothetical protein BAE44_0005922 [Dichanthelium oligosanthes]
MDDHHFVLDRKISKEDEGTAAKQTRSFRYEDYNTRRVFLRSYLLKWDWSPTPDDDDDEKHDLGAAKAAEKRADGPSSAVQYAQPRPVLPSIVRSTATSTTKIGSPAAASTRTLRRCLAARPGPPRARRRPR